MQQTCYSTHDRAIRGSNGYMPERLQQNKLRNAWNSLK
jgi:hypothetical protein